MAQFQIYHSQFASVVDEIINQIKARGFNLSPDFDVMMLNAPAYGETKRGMLQLDDIRRAAVYQVYRLESGTYELNFYIS